MPITHLKTTRKIWLLCFLALSSGLQAEESLQSDGNGALVSGSIGYTGRIEPTAMGGAFDSGDIVEVDDSAARGLEYALVALEPIDKRAIDNPVTPEHPPAVLMDQASFRFVPRVLVAHAEQPVVFGNSDSTNHNIRAISENDANTFNIITRPGKTSTKSFESQPLNTPIRLACDFHPSMEAWIYVLDHPYHAVTDEEGNFEIGPVPPGDYVLRIRDPGYRLRAERPIALGAGDSATVTATFGKPHHYYRAQPPVIVNVTPASTSAPDEQ